LENLFLHSYTIKNKEKTNIKMQLKKFLKFKIRKKKSYFKKEEYNEVKVNNQIIIIILKNINL
jgi:hypothetical protein